MALIICSECGKEFSNKATNCPNCGCPVEKSIGSTVENLMDKIYCPECKNEVLSDGDVCPECGYPLKTIGDRTKQEVKMVSISRKKVLTFSCILYLLSILCFIYGITRVTNDNYQIHKELQEYESYKNQIVLSRIVFVTFCVIGITLVVVGINIQRGSRPKLPKQKLTSSPNSVPYYPSSTSNSSSTSTSEVRCPKCGSTQIQMVTRKWSLLTGFMTNKVDRVCMKCKHRF